MKLKQFALLFTLTITLAGCGMFQKAHPSKTSPVPSLAATNPDPAFVGQDPLGIQSNNFPIKNFVKFMPAHTSAGNLDWSFGESLDHIRQAIGTGKVDAWRTHFYNGPGLRNNRLGSFEPHYGMTIKSFNVAWEKNAPNQVAWLRRRATLYCGLFSPFPNIVLEMSPTLEHDMTKKAWTNAANVIAAACPRARLVNSPDGSVRIGVPFKLEGHGTKWQPQAPCNQSYDGEEAVTADVARAKTRFAVCDYMKIWNGVYNGLAPGEAWVQTRSRKSWPTQGQQRDMFAYQEALPSSSALPPQCTHREAIKAPNIWKPWAENTGDLRANKPVYISNFKAPNGIKVLAENGAAVTTLPLYGNYGDKQSRYYSGGRGNAGKGASGPQFSAFQFSEKARTLSGSPMIYLLEGKTCKGPFHSVYRQGVFK